MYFITAMTLIPRIDSENKDYSSRCFGYYPTNEQAFQALAENRCDMFEYYYGYAVVERIEPGIHSSAEETTWFEYNQEKDGFFPMTDTVQTSFSNFAIG